MWRIQVLVLLLGALGACGCDALPPPLSTPPPVPAPPPAATLGEARPLGVAVAAGTPTATPVLVGDYATLVGPRIQHIQQGLGQLDQQLSVLLKTPLRMADDDWRTQLQAILQDLGASSADLRSVTARVGGQPDLHMDVMRLLDNLDFVVSEYRMALDYDPDGTHFARAGHARVTTEDEVASIVSSLRPPLPAPSPSFGR